MNIYQKAEQWTKIALPLALKFQCVVVGEKRALLFVNSNRGIASFWCKYREGLDAYKQEISEDIVDVAEFLVEQISQLIEPEYSIRFEEDSILITFLQTDEFYGGMQVTQRVKLTAL